MRPTPTTVHRSSPVYGSVLPLGLASVAIGVVVAAALIVEVVGVTAGVVLVAAGVVTGAEVVVCVCVDVWVVFANGSVYCWSPAEPPP